MIECPNCGNLNYEDNNFCGRCGSRLPSPKFCPECGYQSFIDVFCTNCGTKLISQSEVDKIKELMHDARKLRSYRNQDYEKAIRFYDKVLRIYPKYIEALNGKGICFYYLHKYDKAIDCFDTILEIDSNNSSVWRSKGDCLKNLYKYDEAIDCYNNALSINPENQFTLKSKAHVLLSMRKYEGIREILSKIKPEYAYGWIDLSKMYLEINDFDNALKCLDNVDDKDKNSVYREKSEIFQQLGKYDIVIEKCNEKIEIDSNNSLALNIKASCLSSLKKYEDALKCYEKLIEINPNDFSIIFSKCNILLKFKKYDEISDILSKIKPEKDYEFRRLSDLYLKINEFDESIKYLNKYTENLHYFSPFVADTYLKLDKPQMAFDYIHKALKNNPNHYTALLSKGNYYEYRCKFDKALEVYDKLISINKYGTGAYFSKMDLLLKLDEFSEVKQVLMNIKPPNTYYSWYRISKYYEQINDYEKALEYIDKTINLNYNIEYLVKKAEILYNLERYDDAMEVCNKAAKLNSQYDKLIEILIK